MEPATETSAATSPSSAADAGEGPAGAARRRWRDRLRARSRDPWTLGLVGVLLAALLLRLWGIRYGLPYAYNIDERSHFVPRAVGLFTQGTLDPHYQLNPDGFIYLVGAALGIVYHGRHAVTHAYLTNPGDVYLVGRVVSALLGVVAVGLLYAAGRKLVARGTALLAAALLAVSFLAVHYGHLALNDSPALAFIALSLLGAAGIYEDGRRRWYLVAGLGIGLAAAVKYNAGIMLLPLVAAAAARAFAGERKPALVGIGLSVLGILAGFAILDPYAFIHWSYFRHELKHLSVYENGSLLLGETQRSGFRYYLWSLTWGFGWIPLVLCFVGGIYLLARRALWPLAALLIPAPIVFFVFNGAQGRYFARYMLPIFPLMCLVAAIGSAFLVRAATTRRARLLPAAAAVGAVLVLAQGVVYAVHNDTVLSRADTRTTLKQWMVATIPAGAKIVLEPTSPQEWLNDGGRPTPAKPRWVRFGRHGAFLRQLGREYAGARKPSDFANYEYTLYPTLIKHYRQLGYCWIVSSSMQEGRAWRDPSRTPQALPYYAALRRQSDIVYHASPFGSPNEGPQHPFQFDLSFDYEPLNFDRPGPVVTVYKLHDCR
jgi:hypothetical protein